MLDLLVALLHLLFQFSLLAEEFLLYLKKFLLLEHLRLSVGNHSCFLLQCLSLGGHCKKIPHSQKDEKENQSHGQCNYYR